MIQIDRTIANTLHVPHEIGRYENFSDLYESGSPKGQSRYLCSKSTEKIFII